MSGGERFEGVSVATGETTLGGDFHTGFDQCPDYIGELF